MLKNIQIGWVWLDQVLNGIIDQVNAQHVIPSASVAVQEAPNGTILTVGQGGGGGGGGDGTLQPSVKGWTTITFNNWTWKELTVVDPATCQQSTVHAIAYHAGASIVLAYYVDHSNLSPNPPTTGITPAPE
jgi:hypothetical protein